MLRYSLRRFYFALIGLLLLTLPLFAGMRIDIRQYPFCSVPHARAMHFRCNINDAGLPTLLREGPFYAVWQTGTPPNDYWPLALALLAAGGAAQIVTTLRSRPRST